MRITNRMMNDNVMRNLHAGLKRLADLNQQLSTGKKISRPHQDPVVARKSMGFNSSLTQNEQYIRNLDQGISWLETTDTAINQVINVLHKAKALAVGGANDTLNPDDMKAMAEEVDQLLQHALSLSNTQYDDKYIFAGTNTLTKAFELDVDGNINYQGNDGEIAYEIGKGVEITVNIHGDALFDKVFEALQSLRENLGAGEPTLIDGDIGMIDEALNITLREQSKVGAAQNRFEFTKDQLDSQNLSVTELLSKSEDVDIAEVIMHLNMQEAVYRTALGSAARIIQPSLIDFLR